MGEDTPTVRLDAAGSDSGKKTDRSKTLVIVLAIIGVILLVAVAALLTLIFSGALNQPAQQPGAVETPQSQSPSPSDEPSETPSETPSSSPSESPSSTPSPSATQSNPPVATGPVFNSFSPANNKSVGCTNDSDSIPVTFTWTSTGANEAAIGVGTYDAFAGAYETGLPASGSYVLNYQCSNATQIYTVSIRGNSGQANKSITLKR
ncbi:MAG: hypothetical protein KF742_02820 [Cryobacterium sp.]|nr:hypothetical protein [Cryobacterium sp.]MBX3089039.1 hypothetical protein [Cryobacterium sp.]MBX3117163.1 hypothetical protein [Cryobacterium sp.]MCO5294274.1 hypothetical protein [Homoserinimonas sp.]MCW5944339.1 hypothetical protein [Cryobacterium sp.]